MPLFVCLTTRKGIKWCDQRRVLFGDESTYHALSRFLRTPFAPVNIDTEGYTRIYGAQILELKQTLEQARLEIAEKPSSWHVWTNHVGSMEGPYEMKLYADRDHVLAVISEMLALAESAYSERKALLFIGD